MPRRQESKAPKPKQETQQTTANASTLTSVLHVISSHHLLDHAPDNFLAKGGHKFKVNGWYRFGTPGLAFVITRQNDDAAALENFVAALEKKMPQKKFEIILTRPMTIEIAVDGWKEASMGGLKSILTNDEFVSVLNLQGSAATNHTKNNSQGGVDNSSTKSSSKKGKKKKK